MPQQHTLPRRWRRNIKPMVKQHLMVHGQCFAPCRCLSLCKWCSVAQAAGVCVVQQVIQRDIRDGDVSHLPSTRGYGSGHACGQLHTHSPFVRLVRLVVVQTNSQCLDGSGNTVDRACCGGLR